MIADTELLGAFSRLFVGRTDAFLEEPGDCVKSTLTETTLREHLRAQRRIGAYSLLLNGEGGPLAKFLCLDFDGKNLPGGGSEALAQARRAAEALESLGVAAYVEVSRSGTGYHVWVLYGDARVHLDRTQRLGRLVTVLADLPRETEVFPKGSDATAFGCTPYLPLWGFWNGNTERNVFVGYDGEPLRGQDEVLLDLQTVGADEIEAAIREAETRLGDRAKEADEPQREPLRTEVVFEGIAEHERDTTLFRYACKMRRLRIDRPLAEELILKAAERCRPPFPEHEALAKVANAWKYPEGAAQSTAATAEPPDVPRTRPEIVVREELSPVTDEAVAALVADDTSGLYVRAGALSHVIRDDAANRVRGITRPAGAPVVAPVALPLLLERLDRSAVWTKSARSGNVAARPPVWVGQTILARGTWPLPLLEGIAEAPTLRPDGSVLDAPGYDEQTGILFEPSSKFPPLSHEPSDTEIADALALLRVPLADFPFVTEGDGSVAIAEMLSIAGRTAISGPVPAFPKCSPTPGTGKGLLCETICVAMTGRPATLMVPTRDAEEDRKRILALAIQGSRVVLVDNVSGTFGSNPIAAAITAGTVTERDLGVSRMLTAPTRMVWQITGNNLTFVRDLARRVLPCDLDSGKENPEDRGGWTIPDLTTWTRERWPDLVVAALTVLRGYIVAGRPAHGEPEKGSFGAWDRLVRGAVIWAGLADPVATTERIRAEGDGDLDVLREALAAWADVFSAPVTCADAIRRAESHDELQAALLGLVGGDRARLNAAKLGAALRGVKGRPVGGRRFRLAPDKQRRNSNRWAVEETAG